MTEYQIIEEDESGFEGRGAISELWNSRDFEIMISGPADTGKTYGCLQYIDALLWEHPGAQGVMGRKTYSALVTSALQTYKRVIGFHDARCPIKAYGGEKPEWYDYPNGSRLWLVGLDSPGKALSSERDFIYFVQAEELLLEDWEILITRASGRGAVMSYTRVIGDCNPASPSHWILHRKALKLLHSRHEDNPTLYDRQGNLLPEGAKRMAVLDSLTGTRYLRLRKGLWVQAEGVVYDGFNRGTHLLPSSFPIPAGWRRIRTIDFGYTNPFVCQWWAIDPDGRMYLYREIYLTGRIVRDHARQILRLSGGERIEKTICDHDAEDRATLEAEGIPTVPAWKAISIGIQAVQQRLELAGDGKPRLFVFADNLVEIDETLAEKRKPVRTLEEFESYVWPKGADGRPQKEVPVDEFNHGMDAMRYAVAYADGLGAPVSKTFTISNYAGFGTSRTTARRRRSDGW